MIITVRIPIARSSSKRSAMPGLTMSLSWITPRTRVAMVCSCGRSPPAGCRRRSATHSTIGRSSSGAVPPLGPTQRRTESAAPLRTGGHRESTPLIRVCAVNGTSSASRIVDRVQPVVARASSTIDRPSGVSSASADERRPRRPRRRSRRARGCSSAAWRLPKVIVPVLSSSSVDHVAGGLHRPARHRQHVALHEAVHAGDADRREQRPDRGRDEADEQRDEDDDRLLAHPSRSRTAGASRRRAGR